VKESEGRERTGAAWCAFAPTEPPLVAPVSTWCFSSVEAVESLDSFATWSVMPGVIARQFGVGGLEGREGREKVKDEW
jgi:hypothetical protein